MKSSRLFIVILVAAVVAILVYSMSGGSGEEEYMARIENERSEKDKFMRAGEGSPFEGDTSLFEGLKYFPPEPAFRVSANLELVEDRKMVVLPTSDGKEKRYLEYAHASFSLEGIRCQLLILEVVDPGPYKGTLFLAFADETSARETYGAGRYLDLKKTPGASTITLDFNQAYNPYCAYSEDFSCPLPPKENLLKVAIRAGERNYR